MSSRSDSILLTGMNSSSTSKLERSREKEKLRKRTKLEKKSILHPSIEPVIEELEKEKNRVVLELLESVDTKTGDEDFKAMTIALNLYKESMATLKSRLSRIMRVEDDK